jgi:hypothetical protein
MAPVEQIKAKRGGVGLRASDPEKAYPGYTLFTPLTGERTTYLINLAGQVVHTWELPYPGGYGYLTPFGTLFFNAKVPEVSGRFIDSQPWKCGAVVEVDWAGRVLFEVRHPNHHHDGRRLRNGNVLLLCLAAIPRDIAGRVRGGLAGTEHQGVMYGDYLVELTTDGRTVWEWRSWEHLDPETDVITYAANVRNEWTHGNAVAELSDGNIAVSFCTISTVAIVNRATGDVDWKVRPPTLAHQHAPVELPNGNLLIFDNGSHRVDTDELFSRVIEVSRATKEIVWTYRERRAMDFFSSFISNAERLPNGNTLICEGAFGRLFEVTSAGELVWEYVSPYFGTHPENADQPPHNAVFRAFRYGEDVIARARG